MNSTPYSVTTRSHMDISHVTIYLLFLFDKPPIRPHGITTQKTTTDRLKMYAKLQIYLCGIL
jgi:hypothetical protein